MYVCMYEKINYIANSTQKQRNNNKAKQTKADPGTKNAKSFQQIDQSAKTVSSGYDQRQRHRDPINC
jgi:hypothetical protein